METIYRCVFCGKESGDVEETILHEIICRSNPSNKSCAICEENQGGWLRCGRGRDVEEWYYKYGNCPGWKKRDGNNRSGLQYV